MGRQKGEAARSKGRPSSSSLAASLLPSGATAVGFGGYVGSSRLDTCVPSTSDAASSLMDIDGELAQHLKRLSRKDPTTKLKALTTLSTLLKDKSAKDVSPILPQWIFEYKKLLQDYNREVRRATHVTMSTLVSTIGRDLASHLKSLMGPWWFAQFDLDHEVSQAAKRSLQTVNEHHEPGVSLEAVSLFLRAEAAFPAQEKRLDALMLCTDDVFMYLEENLKLTPQSMSDKAIALDELQDMHQQVISASLLALATLIDIILNVKHDLENSSSEQKLALKARSAAVSHAEKLLTVHRCLNFLKSQSSAIRSAAYSLVGSCVKNIPHDLIEPNIKTVAPSILGAFHEKVPTCHSSMWEAVLTFSRKFPESWTTLNVHKIVLNRFWNFLRNGCFGSQQVSYPALVLFLDCVPPKAITVDKFFLEFFQNFWAGKVHSHSSDGDQLAFFQSYRECFLWVLQNAERYCDGVEGVHRFRHTIVDEVLLKMTWHDYLLVPVSEEKMKKSDSKYQVTHLQEFGKCIIEILSGLFSLEANLLSVFCLAFEVNCLDMFQQRENIESCENVDKIIRFLLLVDLHAVRKGDSWPLSYLVGPVLLKFFQLTQAVDLSNPVRFMVVAASTFGPRKFIQEITHQQIDSTFQSKEKNISLSLKQFLQHFNEIFVPWCLQADICSTSARLDLLFALLDDECFSEQCDLIISHAASTYNSKNTSLLALVMERMRDECIKRKLHVDLSHHGLLDFIALSVTHSPFGSSDARFVCAALGGKTEEDQTYLLSKNTTISIFEEIFQKLLSFIGMSSFTWVKAANNELSKFKECAASEEHISSTNVLEMANFSMEVLSGTFYRLLNLVENSFLLPRVLAALFVIDWEHSTSTVFNERFDEETYTGVMDRYNFCISVHMFRRKINKFLKSLRLDCRTILGNTLIQIIRCAVFNEDKLDIDDMVFSGCLFFLDVVDNICQGQDEEQKLLDQLLNEGDSWPLWVMFDVKDGERSATLKSDINSSNASENNRVAAFVDKLISKVGIARVIGGSISSEEAMTCHSDYSRAWLASEMLCTWKWQGGSALTSFLPSLIQYITTQASSPISDNLLDSIVNILIDGAFILGPNIAMSYLTIYPAPHDELESIEHVFLRALMLVFNTLFEDNIWGRSKALGFFNLFVDRLFVGEVVNSSCLKILPVVMSVLVGPLFGDEITNSSEKNEIHDVVGGWLQRTLAFPSLNTWLTGEDMEDWFHLIVSCYPLIGKKEFRPQRYITYVERGLLLELLRKQWAGSASATLNKLPIVQMLLSKLTVVVVRYCWIDFNIADWDFVLYKTRYWIESTVVLMEEVAESVNETITNGPTSDVLENLQHAVLDLDFSSLKLATNAIIVFTLFSRLVGPNIVENEDENEKILLGSDKWDLIKDKILQGILRLLFTTGAAEAIAASYSPMASSIVASSRLSVCYFWELVSSSAVESSSYAIDRAIKSFDIWGLSKGAVSSLYAILFSSKPVPYLQYAAYVILSSEPVADLAFVTRETSALLNENDIDDKDPLDSSLEFKIQLREEISVCLEKSPLEIFEMDLVSPERVHVFVAWSLLISHLLSLPSSPKKEKLIQYIKNISSNLNILDCICQHIPLELCAEKKFSQIHTGISESATRAITDNSVLFAVESLWPIGLDGMASFVGSIYGLMLRTLSAYVRDWFNGLRDRTTSSAVEFFTRTCCSPHLITNELSQIKKDDLCDENFSVSVSKSASEVVATYTKDESRMDLVVRFPLSYSLRPVDVECTRSLGISEVKQRKWLLSMISFVRNQNGGLAEAIKIWKSNFDKEFEGIEECPICYSVIHTSNYSIPKRACKTCKHKFHNACLYRWFLTSNKSTCPLCQSLF